MSSAGIVFVTLLAIAISCAFLLKKLDDSTRSLKEASNASYGLSVDVNLNVNNGWSTTHKFSLPHNALFKSISVVDATNWNNSCSGTLPPFTADITVGAGTLPTSYDVADPLKNLTSWSNLGCGNYPIIASVLPGTTNATFRDIYVDVKMSNFSNIPPPGNTPIAIFLKYAYS